jgi:hypothetical protein
MGRAIRCMPLDDTLTWVAFGPGRLPVLCGLPRHIRDTNVRTVILDFVP